MVYLTVLKFRTGLPGKSGRGLGGDSASVWFASQDFPLSSDHFRVQQAKMGSRIERPTARQSCIAPNQMRSTCPDHF